MKLSGDQRSGRCQSVCMFQLEQYNRRESVKKAASEAASGAHGLYFRPLNTIKHHFKGKQEQGTMTFQKSYCIIPLFLLYHLQG